MTELRFRRPTEADHARVADVVDDWWGGRRLRPLARRLWFRYFTNRSWIAETEEGRLAGFLIGFVAPDDPHSAYVHLAGVDPNRRRRGVGRDLYRRFVEEVAAAGVGRVEAVTWPGNRQSIAFHRALGFRVHDGPGTQPIYGTSAFPDYDGPGEDLALLVLELGQGTAAGSPSSARMSPGVSASRRSRPNRVARCAAGTSSSHRRSSASPS